MYDRPQQYSACLSLAPTLRCIPIHKHSAIIGNAEIIVPHLTIKDTLFIGGMWIGSRNRAARNEPDPGTKFSICKREHIIER